MSEGTTAYDLPATPQSRPRVNQPGDANYWIIPGAVLLTLVFWTGVLIALKSDHDPAISTLEVALFIAAGVFTVSTAIVVKGYLIHRASADDHVAILNAMSEERAAILDEIEDFRAFVVVVLGEQQTLLEQITAKGSELKDLYWENFAEQATKGNGAVVPFGHRQR